MTLGKNKENNNDHEHKQCILCDGPIGIEIGHNDTLTSALSTGRYWAGGHNPWPLAEKGRCCSTCNSEHVLPARIKQIGIPSISKTKYDS